MTGVQTCARPIYFNNYFYSNNLGKGIKFDWLQPKSIKQDVKRSTSLQLKIDEINKKKKENEANDLSTIHNQNNGSLILSKDEELKKKTSLRIPDNRSCFHSSINDTNVAERDIKEGCDSNIPKDSCSYHMDLSGEDGIFLILYRRQYT